MADKGFLIQDELTARQAHLIIPPLLKKKVQFSEEEIDRIRSIANLCIHAEQCMEKIKNYHIFDRAFPISMAYCRCWATIKHCWFVLDSFIRELTPDKISFYRSRFTKLNSSLYTCRRGP